jgi:hypothetical protein
MIMDSDCQRAIQNLEGKLASDLSPKKTACSIFDCNDDVTDALPLIISFMTL